VRDDLPFAPAIEAMWRFGADHWGKGYATEAAVAAMRYGFELAGLSKQTSMLHLAA
jgi:RimJ/RimL family protein N-acetyltransferase